MIPLDYLGITFYLHTSGEAGYVALSSNIQTQVVTYHVPRYVHKRMSLTSHTQFGTATRNATFKFEQANLASMTLHIRKP